MAESRCSAELESSARVKVRVRLRYMSPASYLIWLALATVPLVAARGQDAQITGRITESATRRPLQGARVTILETGAGTITNEAGRYQLPRGRVDRDLTLRVILLGYSPVVRRIPAAAVSAVVDIEIAPQVLSLDEV